jgi:hypothetical protein
MLARKIRAKLVREQKWPSLTFLPFLGDEVTGKTIASLARANRLAMIKKRAGFDMNILLLRSGVSESNTRGHPTGDGLRHALAFKGETWINMSGRGSAARR